jgi:hypothetical protein
MPDVQVEVVNHTVYTAILSAAEIEEILLAAILEKAGVSDTERAAAKCALKCSFGRTEGSDEIHLNGAVMTAKVDHAAATAAPTAKT